MNANDVEELCGVLAMEVAIILIAIAAYLFFG